MERRAVFTTVSRQPVERLYGPDAAASTDYPHDIGDPGDFLTYAVPSDGSL